MNQNLTIEVTDDGLVVMTFEWDGKKFTVRLQPYELDALINGLLDARKSLSEA